MLTAGKQSEEEQRLNAILQRLSGITFVPDNWNESDFWTTLSETGFSKEDILEPDPDLFLKKFTDSQWNWEQLEKLADILVILAAKQSDDLIKYRARDLYKFIQAESKMFSFNIMNKLNNLQ